MKIPSNVLRLTKFVYDNCAKDMGSMLIGTTIVGWVASSAAQIVGIACNRKYSKEQKSFMIPQEIGDAMINIGSFFILTYPLKRFATKLVTTGKIIPECIKKIVNNSNDIGKLGKLSTDIRKMDCVKRSLDEKKVYSLINFMSTSAAVGGGILSSNIITPILRNKYAAKKQYKIKEKLDKNSKSDNPIEDVAVETPAIKHQQYTTPTSPFNNFRHSSITI